MDLVPNIIESITAQFAISSKAFSISSYFILSITLSIISNRDCCMSGFVLRYMSLNCF